ncbi:helix-turn-helix DNA-binding domain protein [Mycobacterium phage Pharaoh]|uniref:Helix-turn-helix DNA-binding domain protein n=1 Tax=Mycobacterium phage Pharaoh TaxID=2530140 RepID=A0A481W1Y7_9CAUD|nr:HTH DNA binding protein [Mycobacterium phage Pharaoh]QBJ00230.1 helix-turn-helix DNA-binding domain protein [Mycobacterium phage Pharaoh]
MSDTIAQATLDIDTLKRGIEVVLDNNSALALENENLRRLADSRYHTIGDLTAQLATAKRAFGDAFVKGIKQSGPTRINRPKLSERDARDIRQAHAGGMKQADLARNYGVNPATISRIVNRVYY